MRRLLREEAVGLLDRRAPELEAEWRYVLDSAAEIHLHEGDLELEGEPARARPAR